MKVLVVGGAGYIGSITVEELLRRGHEVVVFDNLSRGHRQSVSPQATFVLGDAGNSDDVKAALKGQGINAVMHFAAYTAVGESVEHPAVYYNNNVTKAIALLDTMLECGVRKFVFSSTAAVYGNPAGTPIKEDAVLAPTSPYGDTKLALEKVLKWYSNAYGIKYASLRYFNAAGASTRLGEDHEPETHLIPTILQVARGEREHITVFGDDYETPDGTCIRDYIHVVDLSDAHVLALEYLRDPGQNIICNLGSGNGFSVNDVIAAARKVTGHAIPVLLGPRRAGDPPVLVASSALAEKELGWQPKLTDLERIITDAWKWHQAHPCGYSKEAAINV